MGSPGRPPSRIDVAHVLRDENELITHIYCTRQCARRDGVSFGEGLRTETFPKSTKGITGFAICVLTCDGCGDNMSDAVAQKVARLTPKFDD